MISQLFENPLVFFISLICLVLVIDIHEFAHAWAAERLGDPTARLSGRLTLNPLAHIDPIGGLLILIFGFGWGKPVPVDSYNLENPRRDTALVSLAGPVSNFLLAIVLSVLLHLLLFLKLGFAETLTTLFIEPLIIWSVFLGVFNLIPIYPLDGFKVVGGFLSGKQAAEWDSLQRYGFFLLMIFILPLGHDSIVHMFITGPITRFILPFLIPSAGI